MKLYSHPLSLHGYKVRLLLSFIAQPYDLEILDLVNDQQKSAEFIVKHPLGKVPLLEDGDFLVWNSEAILVYLARKFENVSWFPLDAKRIAQVNAWLAFSANEMTNGLAAARADCILGGKGVKFIDRQQINLEKSMAIAHSSLEILNSQLVSQNWLVGDAPTIADIACYAIVSCAPEAKIELKGYPQVEAWCERFKQLSGFIEI
jgi:glutathione S-transferase